MPLVQRSRSAGGCSSVRLGAARSECFGRSLYWRSDRRGQAGGNSFGGAEAVLGVERGGYCAAIDSAGGAQSWTLAPHLQDFMLRWIDDVLGFWNSIADHIDS